MVTMNGSEAIAGASEGAAVAGTDKSRTKTGPCDSTAADTDKSRVTTNKRGDSGGRTRDTSSNLTQYWERGK